MSDGVHLVESVELQLMHLADILVCNILFSQVDFCQ